MCEKYTWIVPQGTTFVKGILLTNEDGTAYTLDENSKIIFGVKSGANDNYIIEKILTTSDISNGRYVLSLSPTETNIPQGTYFFDIGLQPDNENYYIIYPPENRLGFFRIKSTVTKMEVDDS